MANVESDDYYRGFYDGFVEGKKYAPLPKPSPTPDWPAPPPGPYTPIVPTENWGGCPVCKLNLKEMSHYCCMNPKCPSRATFTSKSNNETL